MTGIKEKLLLFKYIPCKLKKDKIFLKEKFINIRYEC